LRWDGAISQGFNCKLNALLLIEFWSHLSIWDCGESQYEHRLRSGSWIYLGSGGLEKRGREWWPERVAKTLHLIGVYLMSMHLVAVYLMAVYPMAVYFMGVYLTGMHLMVCTS
jgi:hypothetical protein